jgi:LysR family glycine cleavage system transcriptional activator
VRPRDPLLARRSRRWTDKPLFEEEVIPVCSPALAADPSRPLRQPADLRAHTLLHMEDPTRPGSSGTSGCTRTACATSSRGRDAFQPVRPAGAGRVNGQGVALGRLPLLRRTLRDKQLVTPFRKSVASPAATT